MDLLAYLGIQITKADAKQTLVTMAVTPETKQPYGLVHGGLNSVLAETAASVAANAYLKDTNLVAVGVDIQTHHLQAVTQGVLVAEATPIRLGKHILVYQVQTHLQAKTTATSFSTVTLTTKQLTKEDR